MHLRNGIFIQHHCYRGQRLLLQRTSLITTEERFIFVYRLVLDAKPVRVDDVAG